MSKAMKPSWPSRKNVFACWRKTFLAFGSALPHAGPTKRTGTSCSTFHESRRPIPLASSSLRRASSLWRTASSGVRSDLISFFAGSCSVRRVAPKAVAAVVSPGALRRARNHSLTCFNKALLLSSSASCPLSGAAAAYSCRFTNDVHPAHVRSERLRDRDRPVFLLTVFQDCHDRPPHGPTRAGRGGGGQRPLCGPRAAV